MKEQTITKLINHLKNVICYKTSMNSYAETTGLPTKYFYAKKKAIEQEMSIGKISDEMYHTIMALYKEIEDRPRIRVSKQSPKSDDPLYQTEETDDRSSTEIERNDKGKIIKYLFTIYIRDKQPIIGSLSRDEMNMVYRMYTNYGSNITQREVSRFFPEYSLADFKRILRAFSITKASAPFAPHVIEENTKSQLLEMQFREKENDFLRTYESDKNKQRDLQLKKYMKENQDLKNQLSDFSSIIKQIDLTELPKYQSDPCAIGERNLIVWLSDMHIGASVSGFSIYQNNYDKTEVGHRLHALLIQLINEVNTYGSFSNVVICNIGDSLDGYNGQTTRGGHELAQNMNNKEQLKTFIEVMTEFFENIINYIPCNSLKYYCVGESNHDGDFGYAANIALKYILESMNISATVFDKFIGEFKLDNTTYVLCHGKDNKDMFKNLPLTLDIKTENFINEYLDNKRINGDVVFVKGDLHQSAVTYGRRFVYKSVASLFGSSEWIHKNFGNTPAAVDYSIIDTKGNMLDGRVIV